ncbi:NAD(P)H-dependent oxidoreductase [Acetanaerobacterium elongatum]|uniref:FMN-dependent NADH-azoreductase n=1 Tax=Acetanaerobacterium elongatum TaxID=258515 RepID=A0A1H0DFE2_9FIRM|nr:NAD(P)H-dependent oxidoreductase [Acetanaerobacterium elongatum]SDN68880.1 FMN-dependent NADH-azoreductase [Acetanaerobacterium elongatum]
MKIVVLNGSPKGDVSVTMRYVAYIQKHYPQHELKVLNIAHQINGIEKNEQEFTRILDEIHSADGVLWAFPLYIFVVIAQYKRFIELIFERNAQAAFKGKYAAVLTTSIHFSDHTAVNYMQGICDDLEMRYVDAFTPHMQDLTLDDGRQALLQFAQHYFTAIEQQHPTLRRFAPLTHSSVHYSPATAPAKLDLLGKRAVVIADSLQNPNLRAMVDGFRNCFVQPPELFCLEDIDIKGGCLGCLQCGYNYECAYTGKDGFIDFFNTHIITADILVFAGAMKDRYLSFAWKRFFDRSFFNTHTPVLQGKQLGFIISGPLAQNQNLAEVFDIYTQWQMATLVGFATDEAPTSAGIDAQLYALACNLTDYSALQYHKPKTFLGVGGWKIFRDEIWGELRFPFVADHKAYKRLGIYRDFPQRNIKSRVGISVLLTMAKVKVIRDSIYKGTMKDNMVEYLDKILDNPNL